MFICLSVRTERLGSHRTNIREIWDWVLIEICRESYILITIWPEDLSIFTIIPRWTVLRMRNVSHRSCVENQKQTFEVCETMRHYNNDVSNQQDATNSVYWSFYRSTRICSTCSGRQIRPPSGAVLTIYKDLVQCTDIAADRWQVEMEYWYCCRPVTGWDGVPILLPTGDRLRWSTDIAADRWQVEIEYRYCCRPVTGWDRVPILLLTGDRLRWNFFFILLPCNVTTIFIKTN